MKERFCFFQNIHHFCHSSLNGLTAWQTIRFSLFFVNGIIPCQNLITAVCEKACLQTVSWRKSISIMQTAYPHEDLQFLVILQLLFVEADRLVVMTTERAVTLNHSITHGTWKLTKIKNIKLTFLNVLVYWHSTPGRHLLIISSKNFQVSHQHRQGINIIYHFTP